MKLKNFFVLCIMALLLAPVTSVSQDETVKKAVNQTYDLNGVFSGAGGKYYMRQLGNEILWYGEEDAVSPTWSNVAHGVIKGNTITVKWADVPKGEVMQSGNLVIKINSNDELELIKQTGEFFATDFWTRIPPNQDQPE
jgi:hypothetical protein